MQWRAIANRPQDTILPTGEYGDSVNEDRCSHQAGTLADSLLKVNSSATWIEDADLTWEINEPDAYALEAGLQLKEKAGVRLWSFRPVPSVRARRYARRWPRAPTGHPHRNDEAGITDPLTLARLMARALEPEKPDLVLTGCNRTTSVTARPA